MTRTDILNGTELMNIAARTAHSLASGAAALLLFAQGALAISFASQAPQAPDSDMAQDYSHALALDTGSKQGVIGFRLPQSVYLHSRSAGLQDLRLFDINGAPLPFALHVPPAKQVIRERSLPAKIFPLTSYQRSTAGDAIALDVRTAADGTLLSVTTVTGKNKRAGVSANAPLVGLVLDVRQSAAAGNPESKPLIKALRFNLPASHTAYAAQVWLEVSDDLKQWDTIGAAELSWLANSDTQTLANDSMEFEPQSFRYARLTWRSGEPLQFASITADSITRIGDAPVLDTLVLQPEAGKVEQDLVYRAGVAIPVEKIGLQFSEENIVLPATYGRYQVQPRKTSKEKAPAFLPITRTNFYRITQNGNQRDSGDMAIPVTHLDEWVMRPQIATASKPALRLSWQPATLVFLANGAAPYTLAFGRDKVNSAQLALSQVAPGFNQDELGKLEQASTGPLQEQKVHASDETSGDDPAQFRKWILWGVLLLGVAVLAVLARGLIRQMK
jgi:hypothetical protein